MKDVTIAWVNKWWPCELVSPKHWRGYRRNPQFWQIEYYTIV